MNLALVVFKNLMVLFILFISKIVADFIQELTSLNVKLFSFGYSAKPINLTKCIAELSSFRIYHKVLQ